MNLFLLEFLTLRVWWSRGVFCLFWRFFVLKEFMVWLYQQLLRIDLVAALVGWLISEDLGSASLLVCCRGSWWKLAVFLKNKLSSKQKQLEGGTAIAGDFSSHSLRHMGPQQSDHLFSWHPPYASAKSSALGQKLGSSMKTFWTKSGGVSVLNRELLIAWAMMWGFLYWCLNRACSFAGWLVAWHPFGD